MNSTALTTLQVDFNDTNWVVNTTAFMFLMVSTSILYRRIKQSERCEK